MRFRVLHEFFVCVIMVCVSNDRLIFRKMMKERLLCVTQRLVQRIKHRYPLLLSTAMVRFGLPLPEILTNFTFQYRRRLLPVVSWVKLPKFHP